MPEFNTAIARLRDALDDPVYESLAREGEKMASAAMGTYAYDQIAIRPEQSCGRSRNRHLCDT